MCTGLSPFAGRLPRMGQFCDGLCCHNTFDGWMSNGLDDFSTGVINGKIIVRHAVAGLKEGWQFERGEVMACNVNVNKCNSYTGEARTQGACWWTFSVQHKNVQQFGVFKTFCSGIMIELAAVMLLLWKYKLSASIEVFTHKISRFGGVKVKYWIFR